MSSSYVAGCVWRRINRTRKRMRSTFLSQLQRLPAGCYGRWGADWTVYESRHSSRNCEDITSVRYYQLYTQEAQRGTSSKLAQHHLLRRFLRAFTCWPGLFKYSLPSIQQSTYTEDVGGLSCSLLLFITRTRSILTTVVHDVCQPASVYVPDLPVVYYLFDRKAFKRSKRNYSTNPNRFDRLVRLYPVNNESVSTFENISKELLQPENHSAFLYVPILQFLWSFLFETFTPAWHAKRIQHATKAKRKKVNETIKRKR